MKTGRIEDVETITEAWENFSETCMPANASLAQQATMEQCFWAGAVATFGLITRSSDLPEYEAMAKLQAFDQELKKWHKKLTTNVPQH